MWHLNASVFLFCPLKAYCCISFSTVSSSINALVAVTVEDFILPVCKNLTEKQVYWMNMGLSKLCKKYFHSSLRMSRNQKKHKIKSDILITKEKSIHPWSPQDTSRHQDNHYLILLFLASDLKCFQFYCTGYNMIRNVLTIESLIDVYLTTTFNHKLGSVSPSRLHRTQWLMTH